MAKGIKKAAPARIAERTEIVVELLQSEYGTPQPRAQLRWRGNDERMMRADLMRFAARVEELAAPQDGWCVVVETGVNSGYGGRFASVWIEVAEGDGGEVTRAMISLQRAASAHDKGVRGALQRAAGAA